MTPETNRFLDIYDQWLVACLAEYNEKFGESRHFFQVPQGNYDPGDVVEFAEDGTAYPHGKGGVNYIRNAVTPWNQFEFF